MLKPWAKGFWTGAVLTGVLLGIAMSARVDAFVRATTGDQIVLDARVDEGPLRRAVNIPLATLGDVSVGKRSYLFVTTYQFTLHLRPDRESGSGRAGDGLTVSAQLPGTITATNAPQIAGGVAHWPTVPPEGLELHTRAVQWLTIVLVLAAFLLTGVYQRS